MPASGIGRRSPTVDAALATMTTGDSPAAVVVMAVSAAMPAVTATA